MRICVIVAGVSACWAQSDGPGAGQIDRLLAAVNGKVITEGDLQLAHNLNALMLFGRPAQPLTRSEEIDRLIDMEILRQELENFPLVPEDESRIEAKIQEFKGVYAEIGGLPATLSRLGLQESELLSYLKLQTSMLKFVSLRFRPFVSVTDEEVESYYHEKLVPDANRGGSQAPPAEEVSSKIREILAEEKVNRSMDQWIQDMRNHVRIERFGNGGSQGAVGGRTSPAENARE